MLIKSIDIELFEYEMAQISDFRNAKKQEMYIMEQKLTRLAKELHLTASKKLQKLEEFKVLAETCFKMGN